MGIPEPRRKYRKRRGRGPVACEAAKRVTDSPIMGPVYGNSLLFSPFFGALWEAPSAALPKDLVFARGGAVSGIADMLKNIGNFVRRSRHVTPPSAFNTLTIPPSTEKMNNAL